ncbi:hypothetical protein, partial [Pseudomonas aeruginosa]|uniref:hypothetical protein n=1 Tax=Pseudomonas aeruginosa TaxID=287 RepID=UPI0031B6728B
MNFANVQLVGGKIGNGFHRGFVGIKALNQWHADNDFFARCGEFFQIIQHPGGVTVGPLFKRRVGLNGAFETSP